MSFSRLPLSGHGLPQIVGSCTREANRDAGAKFAPGRTGKARGPAGLQQKERLKADPMADFRPSQTVAFVDYTDAGASDAMSRLPSQQPIILVLEVRKDLGCLPVATSSPRIPRQVQ